MSEASRRDITIQAIRYMNLRVKGEIYPSTDEVMVRCPIHGGINGDKNPSCGINLKNGVYNCFACGSHGSIESMFYKVTGENLYKALGIKNDPFSNFARNQLYENISFESEEIEDLKVQIQFDIDSTIPAYESELARKYLIKRGISEEVSYEANMRYSDDIMINGKQFGKRLLIPIYEKHNLISIEGRRILDNDEIKVLYPKNSSVNTLYDLDNLDFEKPVYCVEGLMDMFVMRNCKELRNSTCIFGACLTNRQKLLLQKFKKLIYSPDQDTPGLAVLDKLKEIQNGNIYYLRLPKEINGNPIKDIGDLPKYNLTINDLIARKWLKYEKYLA